MILTPSHTYKLSFFLLLIVHSKVPVINHFLGNLFLILRLLCSYSQRNLHITNTSFDRFSQTEGTDHHLNQERKQSQLPSSPTVLPSSYCPLLSLCPHSYPPPAKTGFTSVCSLTSGFSSSAFLL